MTHALVCGEAPDGTPIVAALVARRYRVEGGRCQPEGDVEPVAEIVYYPHHDIEHRGWTRPSLVRRDIDLWAWREHTDLVVQGDIIAREPVTELAIELACDGAAGSLRQRVAVTGDRVVKRGTNAGLHLSDPKPFRAMPLRYDKAYGGTDEEAERRNHGAARRDLYLRTVGEEEALEWGEYSYPRNPAGKGYVVRDDSVVGTPWPNLELIDDRLTLDALVMAHERWGERPLPAAFDWFPHAWFPRSRAVLPMTTTADGRVPHRERELGMTEVVNDVDGMAELPPYSMAQGAHPLLCRTRLAGNEHIRVGCMARDGSDFEVELPGARPNISLGLLGAKAMALPVLLDLVFVEPTEGRVTLLWRGTFSGRDPYLPVDWVERSTCVVR